MLIDQNTNIAALIKANPAAIDAIASINRHFEKLRNPLLRKILASRVTIADAARIGNSSVEVFFDKLRSIGFNVSAASTKPMTPITEKSPRPAFLNLLPANLVTELDVREDIQSGNDPFLKIMDAIETLPEGGALCLINTFEPTPLIAILKKRGFHFHTDHLEKDLVHTYFFRPVSTSAAEASPAESLTEPAASDFEFMVADFDGLLQEVDVRQMEMPLPMVTILAKLDQLPPWEALFVHHKRVPQMLLPQLAERGFSIRIKQVAEGEVKLLIYHTGTI